MGLKAIGLAPTLDAPHDDSPNGRLVETARRVRQTGATVELDCPRLEAVGGNDAQIGQLTLSSRGA